MRLLTKNIKNTETEILRPGELRNVTESANLHDAIKEDRELLPIDVYRKNVKSNCTVDTLHYPLLVRTKLPRYLKIAEKQNIYSFACKYTYKQNK